MLDRQPLATLRSAALYNGASVLCRHPRAEPVLFGASAIVWLKRSLRHCRSPSAPLSWSENLEFTRTKSPVSKRKEAETRPVGRCLTSKTSHADHPRYRAGSRVV